PANPTESDVQIIAKPKGKRPLSISQLSGGEKTLTAIALLFGIYLLKPAPFCIFDEVDAPLDDTNIDKFNNIIKKFSKDSQFIIILLIIKYTTPIRCRSIHNDRLINLSFTTYW